MSRPWVIEAGTVVVNRQVDETMAHLSIAAPLVAEAAGPGQFITLALAGPEPVLPRPFDLHFADPGSGRIDVIYRIKGRGTHELASLRPGEPIEVHGPFGNAVDDLLRTMKRVALVGRGAGISPLSFIARRAHAYGADVVAYVSARNQRLLAPFADLAKVARVTAQSDDVQPGCLVTDRFRSDLEGMSVDASFVVGSKRLARATLALAEEHAFVPYVFAETYMPCGFGHCKACAIPTSTGYLLACLDGPVIDLRAVRDEYWSIAPS